MEDVDEAFANCYFSQSLLTHIRTIMDDRPPQPSSDLYTMRYRIRGGVSATVRSLYHCYATLQHRHCFDAKNYIYIYPPAEDPQIVRSSLLVVQQQLNDDIHF